MLRNTLQSLRNSRNRTSARDTLCLWYRNWYPKTGSFYWRWGRQVWTVCNI